MIEKVLGDRRRAADRRPVGTFKDNVALCAQAKVRCRPDFSAALLAAEHASFIFRSTEGQKERPVLSSSSAEEEPAFQFPVDNAFH
jgi:hypothetical protein